MLRFFREKAALFVWIIVICFVITLGAGTFMYDFSNDDNSSDKSYSKIVQVGNYSINRDVFQSAFSMQLSGLVRDNQLMVSSDSLEALQFKVFQSLLFEEVLYQEALERSIKVSSRDKKAALNEFLIRYDLKDKKALKSLLKSQGRSYKTFEKSFKRSILMQKLSALIQNAVIINDKNIDDSFSELLVEYVYVQANKDSVVFEEFKNKNSIDDYDAFVEKVEKSDLLNIVQSTPRWISYGDLPKVVMDKIFLLNDGQLSNFIVYGGDLFLVKRLDSRFNDKPKDYDQNSYKETFLNALKSSELELLFSFSLADQDFKFNDANLNAIYYKMNNNIDAALGAYQLISSQQVNNPVPHYFLAKLYLAKGNNDQATKEFQKAEVKTDLLKNFSFPELFFVMGQFYEFNEKSNMAKKYYNRALEMSAGKKYILEPLKNKFKELDYQVELKTVTDYLAKLEIEMNSDAQKEDEAIVTN